MIKNIIASVVVASMLTASVAVASPAATLAPVKAQTELGVSLFGGNRGTGFSPATECALLLAALALQVAACSAGAIPACWTAAVTSVRAAQVCGGIIDGKTGGTVAQ